MVYLLTSNDAVLLCLRFTRCINDACRLSLHNSSISCIWPMQLWMSTAFLLHAKCVKDYIRLKVLSLVLHGTAPSVKESYNLTSLFVHCFTDDFVVFTPNLGDTNG